MFANEKILEEYNVKIYEIDPYFYKKYIEKIKAEKMDMNTYDLELTFILVNII